MVILPAPLNEVENLARQDRRAARYIARRFLHFNSSIKRLRFCGVDPVQAKHSAFSADNKFSPRADVPSGHVTVKATGTGTNRRAGYGSLQVCGSVWSCPVCSAKINNVRAGDIARAVSSWHTPMIGPDNFDGTRLHRGGRMVFLTLTMRHHAGQELDDLWTRGVSGGWHAVTSGRAWKTDQADYGVYVPREVKTGAKAGQIVWNHRIGYARVVETTHGRNGWHVHIHALLFVKPDMTWKETKALGASVFQRWSDALVTEGFDAPTLEHGVDVKLVGPKDPNKVADYFTKNSYAGRDKAGKLAWEAAGGIGKWARGSNRTPFQILQALCSGEDYPDFEKDVARWYVWEAASKGKRQLTWSPWLRPYLKLAAELSDEEIAASELGGEIVLRLRGDQHDAVVSVGAHKLLNAVEADDDMTAAHQWLDEHLGLWRINETYGLNPNGDWVAVGTELEKVN